ncbi:hypothetical protein L7F22_044197 [Adiantum nelumboides]|nr:hypothetical protein [Adiantum nelumboides]
MAGTTKKTKKPSSTKRACIRCNSITVKCDGKQPCSRCVSNHNGDSCCYAPTSAPPSTTIGQASKSGSASGKRLRQRHDSIATTTSSMITIDDDETSIMSTRRDTASSVGSNDAFMFTNDSWGQLSVFQQSQMQQQIQQPPHPFELPQMDNFILDSTKPSSLDLMTNLPNFFSICPPPPQQQQEYEYPPQQFAPIFDWSSLMQIQPQQLPFSGSASNKDLNGTLLSEDVRMASLSQDSTFPSPSIHALQQHNLHMHDLANQQFGRIQSTPNTTADLSAFAMAIAQNNSSFDGLMRSLSSGYGVRTNNNGESLAV